jgi:uncharacterized protein (DUF1015 family)
VPRFEPFAALRYAADQPLDRVAAPPYDVLSDDDVDALLRRDPHNIVAVDVPRERDGADRYAAAAQRLQSWIDEGVLVRDRQPTFTLYRMSFRDETGRERETVGVIGALEVVDEGAGGVLPHERTTPKATTDRLDLTIATQTNLSPVWGLSLAGGLTELLLDPGEPVGSCVDEHGVRHTVERISDGERIRRIRETVGSAPVVIADGHHRYAVSRTYRDQRRIESGRDDLAAELTMTYVGELVEDQLSVAAIHRLVTGIAAAELRQRLGEWFEMSPAGPVTAAFAVEVVDRGAMCLVDPDGSGTFMTPRGDRFDGVRDLDSARLEHALAGFDGIELAYQHGVANVVDAVQHGRCDAGVLIRPVSIAEIRRTANEGLLMPPKSTFFAPKLRTGPVIRPLDE